MKKTLIFASMLAAMVAFTSCDEGKNGGDINLDDIVLDGFYVYGPATGSDKVESKNAMSAGNIERQALLRTDRRGAGKADKRAAGKDTGMEGRKRVIKVE